MPTFRIASLIMVNTVAAIVTTGTTVSVPGFPPLGQQHACVRGCITDPAWNNDVGGALSCDSPYLNNCYCATASESASVASSWLSYCVSSRCSAGDLPNDVTSAISVYCNYCLTASYTVPGAEAFITAPPAPAATSSSPTVTVTIHQGGSSGPQTPGPSTLSTAISTTSTTVESHPTTPESSENNGGHLSVSAEIATIVGTVVGAITLVATILGIRWHVNQKP